MTSAAHTFQHSGQTVVIRAMLLMLIAQIAGFAAHYFAHADTRTVSDSFASPLLIHAVAAVLTLLIFLLAVSALRARLQASAMQVQQSSEETDDILDTVKDGLFLLNPDFSIGRKHSRALGGIFAKDELAGANFLELLATIVPEKTVTLSEEYLTLLFGNRVNENLVTDLNPLDKVEVYLADREGRFESKFLEFGFRRVIANKKVTHLLVHADDVTERVTLEKQLAAAKEKWNEQLDLLFKVLHVEPSSLISLITKIGEGLNDINEILKERSQSPATHRDKLDRIEMRLADMAQQAAELDVHAFEEKAQGLQAMLDQLRAQAQIDGKDFLPLAVKLDEFIGLLDALHPVLVRIDSLRGVLHTPTRSQALAHKAYLDQPLWSELQETTKALADDLGKRVEIHLQGMEYLPDDYHERVAALLHEMAANSLIHGIETPTERIAAKKAESGSIQIDVRQVDDNGYELIYRDDGRGLSESKIRLAAINAGLGSAEDIARWDRKKLFSLIFRAGFSTQQSAGDAEGGADSKGNSSGNGMNIVSTHVRDAGGKLWLISADGKSCQFRLWFPELAFNMTDELELA